MYHSTRSECLVLIKSTIVQVDDRALGASHELELAVEGREALVDLELVTRAPHRARRQGVPQRLSMP
jgi:hypothetical protein